ncbi:MAG: RnfABCDGE type electron transport complex subunit A [Oscillospiraceae bacterium]|nr:RnfABCDGE type electron transport complex subunit A [Oscillospiraceae bacterium]
MQAIITILIAGLFTDNFVLSKFLGVCPFLGVSKRLDTAVGMGAAVAFVMVVATAITYPLHAWLLLPLGLGYLQTILFIIVIASTVQLIEIFLKRYIPPLYNALGVFLPLMTTNCAIMGVTILHFTTGLTYFEAMINAFAGGVGFLLAMVLFAGVRSRLEGNDIPKSLEGMPITLIAAAIMSMSFLGFVGLADGLFS